MTFEEVEQGLKVLQDNMTVQGVMMYRLENNLDRLEAVVAQNSQAIHHLANGQAAMHSAMNSLFEHLDHLTERIDRLADGQASMQSAMHSLFEQIDRFLRGLESDGHKKKGKRGN